MALFARFAEQLRKKYAGEHNLALVAQTNVELVAHIPGRCADLCAAVFEMFPLTRIL